MSIVSLYCWLLWARIISGATGIHVLLLRRKGNTKTKHWIAFLIHCLGKSPGIKELNIYCDQNM